MASKPNECKAKFEALAKGAYLELLLPKTSQFDAASLIESGSAEELAKTPTRRNLFFDERTAILLVLRTSASEEEAQSLLLDLEITVTAHATDAVPSSSGHAASVAGKHDIATIKVSGDQSATLVSSGDQTYVIWKSIINLTRPRARLHRPAVYFTAALGLSTSSSISKNDTTTSMMTPYQASPRNVLEPLTNAAEFQGKQIHLAEDRITKVAPRTFRDDTVKPIRGATKRAFPIMPAIFARVRFSSLSDAVIACLHLETSTTVVGALEVAAVDVKVLDEPGKTTSRSTMNHTDPARTVSCLTDAMLPLKLSPGDEQVLLYQIATESATATLTINIQATVIPEEGSQIDLVIKSQAKIDAKSTSHDTIYQWSQPKPMAADRRIVLPPRTKSLPSHAKGLKTATPQISGTSTDGSVSFMISAPETVSLSQDFGLKIKCINNSTRERSFSFQPVQQKPAVLRAPTKAITRKTGDMTVQLLDRKDKADVFYHTPVVKSGTMRATASCEIALSVNPCVLGVLDLGLLRIVDLDNNQMVEVKDLPDVICLEADAVDGATSDFAIVPPPVHAEAESKEDKFWNMVHTSWATSDGT